MGGYLIGPNIAIADAYLSVEAEAGGYYIGIYSVVNKIIWLILFMHEKAIIMRYYATEELIKKATWLFVSRPSHYSASVSLFQTFLKKGKVHWVIP